ncbi:MAG: hypothetical protein A3A61_02790 [Candidatus Woykebacteria bacterium RIFCSPLOWO2_01_FULL_43_14]|uniref:Ribbon-helix-helix protein CopG domain-containing protein n=1 Tax=Candidatus Woykebacteria bacterium RIFCSPLOWO2_01_FULL_43_14 TaxID=1802605 RepID=A0A1G1WWQ4_9BACT|nr:MAG: hypothetical protein A3A61_02790 [Candidatus Woykebacteria bacterium RIFCSPLOWO2_01_FULL_43_14]
MATVTISLPDQIAKKIDLEAKKQGFATRSEFIRSLLREKLYQETHQEELVLEPFVPRPLEEIEDGLRKTGLYNEKFIRSLVKGLSTSSFYANKTSKK